jgi:sugar (pentulose or hexulose) kinase
VQNCYLGLDLGTSGCRAVAIDSDKRLIAQVSVHLASPLRSPDGGSQQNPALWWLAVVEALSRLAGKLSGHHPRALALDATATSLLLATPDGIPLGSAIMYDDNRALSQAELIRKHAPPDSPVHGASSSLAKLLYLNQAHAPAPGTLVLHQADWIIGRLSGRFGFSDWNNCLRLGFDPADETWCDWLRLLDLGGILLPQVFAPGTPVGRLLPELADRIGLPTDLKICTGTTDSTASVLATGIAKPGDGVTVLGSTLVIKLVSPVPVTAPESGVYSHRLGDLWLAGGASNSGGAVLRRYFTDEQLQDLSGQLRPEFQTGLDYYPLLRPGERFPVADPYLAPRLQPRPAGDRVFLQGLLEGMAAIEVRGYRLLEELGAPPVRRVVSIGGGARNEAWRIIRENFLGVPVGIAQHQEAAYGAALLAWDAVVRTNKNTIYAAYTNKR